MCRLLSLVCFLAFTLANAQPPALELTPAGFEPIQADIPSIPNEKMLELSKNWAVSLNRLKKGYDATGVTSNSMVISAFKKNAFLVRNKGEAFQYTINYSMKLSFHSTYYTMHFVVNDIYTDEDVLVKYKLPDYFDNDGNIKDGYDDLKPTLEKSVNELALSYHNFIVNYR